MKNECYGCGKRYPGCHSECESYKALRAEIDKQNERKRKIKETERSFDHIEFERWHNKRKGKR